MFELFAVASAIFGGASVVEGAKANRRNRRAQAVQRQLSDLRAAKERRQSIRETRIAYATAENNAAIGGVMESSGSQGGLGSILTQGNSNLAFLDQQQKLANLSGKWLDSAAKAEGAANMFSGLSQLAGSAAFVNWGAPAAPTKGSGAYTGSGNKFGATPSSGTSLKGPW